MRNVAKSFLYRHEVTQVAMECLLQAVLKFEGEKLIPQQQQTGIWKRAANENDFKFLWSDDTQSIVRKINASDSFPGALCNILNEAYYGFGVVEEEKIKGKPGEIIAKRNEAICIATKDGAVWIQCLKKKEDGSIKLPATIALGDKANDIPVSEINIFEDNLCEKTFREIKYEEAKGIGYLHFDFYNGAMSTTQCNRLREAFITARHCNTKVIVLTGGRDIWSNGIHLNVIEASQNPAQISWENINAMNDLIKEIICTDTHYIISAMQGNAGAGGVALALAADKVLARKGIIFNPHTRNMGLYGSEYWTYLLPKRIGTEKANLFTEQCLPWGTDIALEVKLIDDCFEYSGDGFREKVKCTAEKILQLFYFPKLLASKKFKRKRDESYKPLQKYRNDELEKMHKNIFEDDLGYDWKRHCFVHKINPRTNDVIMKDLFSERRKIWRRRKDEKMYYEV
jgi:putative two-component system hydrogenase maturation factor HypX/HoxX